jgi:hypothetical protein
MQQFSRELPISDGVLVYYGMSTEKKGRGKYPSAHVCWVYSQDRGWNCVVALFIRVLPGRVAVLRRMLDWKCTEFAYDTDLLRVKL